ncbi:MAG: hypothetical protein H6929_23800 [Rhodoferax sp.]|nr:hypothetical protein [Rhodoferax sp.]MCW5630396.1 hypothetical protein [Rhodoferax sp.]
MESPNENGAGCCKALRGFALTAKYSDGACLDICGIDQSFRPGTLAYISNSHAEFDRVDAKPLFLNGKISHEWR